MMSTMTPERIHIGAIEIRFLLEGSATGGAVAVFEFDVPAGARVPAPHSHDGYEETLYGLRGTLTWTVAGERIDVRPGEALCIPRGVVHMFQNDGDEDATALAVVTPGILGPDYFRDMSAVVDAAAAAGGPPDVAEIVAVMRRHGLTPAPPSA
jgi:quercetin dioxygenase-like cupin family protein